MSDSELQNREKERRDAQQAKLLWAPALTNSSAIIATAAFVGSAKDVDFAFSNLSVTLALFGLGLVLSAIGFAVDFIHTNIALKFIRLLQKVTDERARHDRWVAILSSFSPNIEVYRIVSGSEEAAAKNLKKVWIDAIASLDSSKKLYDEALKEMGQGRRLLRYLDWMEPLLWITIILSLMCFAAGLAYTLIAHDQGWIQFQRP